MEGEKRTDEQAEAEYRILMDTMQRCGMPADNICVMALSRIMIEKGVLAFTEYVDAIKTEMRRSVS